MISYAHALDRKIKQSNIEEIFERLCIPTTDQSFAEVLAEFGIEIRHNPFFEPYIKNIGDKENEYRQKPDIASILQKATYTPAGQQALDQKMLTRIERISEYFSLWSVLRFNELYDISLHEQVCAELIAKNDQRDLADFEEGVILISNILEGNSNANLADYYLPHAHRVMSGIINFFDQKNNIVTNELNETVSNTGRLVLDKKNSILIVDKQERLITAPLKLRYISLFFNRDGYPNGKKFSDDEIHSKVFCSDADTRTNEFKKKEKDQVSALKRDFKDIMEVRNRVHFVKSEYSK